MGVLIIRSKFQQNKHQINGNPVIFDDFGKKKNGKNLVFKPNNFAKMWIKQRNRANKQGVISQAYRLLIF